MIVCGKNVAREVINSNYNIKNIYLNENFNNGEILKLIEKIILNQFIKVCMIWIK